MSNEDKRKFKRRPVLDSFSLFVSVPKKGGYRLPIHDLSEGGMGIDLDIEDENWESFPIKRGDSLEVHLYLNQTLYLPLVVQIAWVSEGGKTRKVGLEIKDAKTSAAQAFNHFILLLDKLEAAGKIVA